MHNIHHTCLTFMTPGCSTSRDYHSLKLQAQAVSSTRTVAVAVTECQKLPAADIHGTP
jgi:hypothetical protein